MTLGRPPSLSPMHLQVLPCALLVALDVAAAVSDVGAPKMVPIPGGTFVMGYSKTPLPASLLPGDLTAFADGDADESPAHLVTLSAFSLGATEVTKNATRYAAWLAEKTGEPYRLPTEAEWEYGARGSDPSTNSSYFWTGDEVPTVMAKAMDVGNDSTGGLPSPKTAVPLTVGRFAPNSFGLHDTLGNVEEWCSDWHGLYAADAATDPTGPADGIFRVSRGGSHSTSRVY